MMDWLLMVGLLLTYLLARREKVQTFLLNVLHAPRWMRTHKEVVARGLLILVWVPLDFVFDFGFDWARPWLYLAWGLHYLAWGAVALYALSLAMIGKNDKPSLPFAKFGLTLALLYPLLLAAIPAGWHFLVWSANNLILVTAVALGISVAIFCVALIRQRRRRTPEAAKWRARSFYTGGASLILLLVAIFLGSTVAEVSHWVENQANQVFNDGPKPRCITATSCVSSKSTGPGTPASRPPTVTSTPSGNEKRVRVKLGNELVEMPIVTEVKSVAAPPSGNTLTTWHDINGAFKDTPGYFDCLAKVGIDRTSPAKWAELIADPYPRTALVIGPQTPFVNDSRLSEVIHGQGGYGVDYAQTLRPAGIVTARGSDCQLVWLQPEKSSVSMIVTVPGNDHVGVDPRGARPVLVLPDGQQPTPVN